MYRASFIVFITTTKCTTNITIVPYILKSNPHPNLIRTHFLAIS